MPRCIECGGRKEVPCTRCHASPSRKVGPQTTSCQCCKRKGQMDCPACGGTGKAGPGAAALREATLPSDGRAAGGTNMGGSSPPKEIRAPEGQPRFQSIMPEYGV